MWSEGYTFPAAAVRDEFRRVWPDGGDEYLRFCDVMEEHHREMRALGGRLLDVFFETLSGSPPTRSPPARQSGRSGIP
ncbi:hypothetical protein C2845_PM05G13770 [Panicum miliaceum]|uniref:Uncharacterized protein n=1 Tax=Panicum miliaceum TaxID=4540 RepID=A0A3L6SU15_PANMI|nr:hypothetical protein C2845_PM05G13770 [Panicum miliaceum]